MRGITSRQKTTRIRKFNEFLKPKDFKSCNQKRSTKKLDGLTFKSLQSQWDLSLLRLSHMTGIYQQMKADIKIAQPSLRKQIFEVTSNHKILTGKILSVPLSFI